MSAACLMAMDKVFLCKSGMSQNDKAQDEPEHACAYAGAAMLSDRGNTSSPCGAVRL